MILSAFENQLRAGLSKTLVFVNILSLMILLLAASAAADVIIIFICFDKIHHNTLTSTY